LPKASYRVDVPECSVFNKMIFSRKVKERRWGELKLFFVVACSAYSYKTKCLEWTDAKPQLHSENQKGPDDMCKEEPGLAKSHSNQAGFKYVLYLNTMLLGPTKSGFIG
jgi:hypothetical protein